MIFLLDEIDSKALSFLQASKYCISSNIKDIHAATAFFVRSSHVSKKLIDMAPHLKIIARAGVGLDAIDTQYAHSKHIEVYNTPHANTKYAVETTLALILAWSHKIIHAHNLLYTSKIWDRKSSEGSEIAGKCLGIVGCGNIGSRLAKIASAFDMKIKAFDPYITISQDGIIQIDSLDHLLSEADIISFHIPLTEETNALITKDKLKLMKKSALLVNTSRGKIIVEKDLICALQEEWIAGAALDVFSEEPLPRTSPLFTLDNVIMLPHIGGAGIECRKNAAILAAKKIINCLDSL